MVFEFGIVPVPASRPRVGRWGTYYLPTYDNFRKDMAKIVATCPKLMIEVPMKMGVVFKMPIPKSWSKKKREELAGKYCVSNMDLDNLEKALYDSLNGYLIADDKYIVEHTVRKVWTTGSGSIILDITKL